VPVLADDDVVVHEMPSGAAMSTVALVIWMSACDGVGSPEGWSCRCTGHPFEIISFSSDEF
jgi:hypothetical protein